MLPVLQFKYYNLFVTFKYFIQCNIHYFFVTYIITFVILVLPVLQLKYCDLFITFWILYLVQYFVITTILV